MADVRLYHWRKWERRAETLLRNAEALFSDTYDALGVDHPFVNATDDTMAHMEEMLEKVQLRIEQIKSRTAHPTGHPQGDK